MSILKNTINIVEIDFPRGKRTKFMNKNTNDKEKNFILYYQAFEFHLIHYQDLKLQIIINLIESTYNG